jgi:hypothetical protein
MPVAQLSHAAASSAGFVVWHLSQHRQERRTCWKERRKGARVKTTPPTILSTIARKVTRRTMTGPNASHSLKAAESLSRCPHTRQRVKALLGASRSLSALISAPYGSGCRQDASKVEELRAPKVEELRAPKVEELRAPKVETTFAKWRIFYACQVGYILRFQGGEYFTVGR